MLGRGKRVAFVVAGAALAGLLFTGCSAQPGGDGGAEGTWGKEAQGMPQLVLAEDGSLSGTDGCNRLMGKWTAKDDGTVDFGQVATTMMACEGVDTWLSGLSTGTVEGNVLHVKDTAGKEIGTLDRA